MFTKFRLPFTLALGPVITHKDFDVPKRGIYVPLKNDDETGWDRIKKMFATDQFGRMSQELNSIYQAATLGGFVGAVYGGFLGSRKSYMDFMDSNQATAFENHLDAKRKLQDQVTMGFAKNAFRFGWRLALFTTSYTAITTSIAVYRGKSSFVEYVSAGALTAAMYKFNMGLRGMTAGALIGGGLGTLAGGFTLLILKTTGMTMEEARYWQYEWRRGRDDTINDALKVVIKGSDQEEPLFDTHDQEFASKSNSLDLKILDLQEQTLKKETVKM